MSARLVFLVSLVGATLPVCRVDAASPPLRVDDPNFKGQILAPLRTLVTTPGAMSLRRGFRRSRLNAPNGFGIPERSHAVAGSSWSRGLSSSTFEGMPVLQRRHNSPPATGPPDVPVRAHVQFGSRRTIASTVDAERRSPQATFRRRVPRKPP